MDVLGERSTFWQAKGTDLQPYFLKLILQGDILVLTTFWLLAYLSLSLVLKFDPPISRWFVLIAYLIVLVL